jgi:hypothetical protein
MDVTAKMFGNPDFAELNAEHFDAYVEYRVHGYHSSVAFRRIFDEYENIAHLAVDYVEHNPYFRRQFEKRLAEIKMEELWGAKTAAHELLSVARNVFAKDSTRLNAMKELNVLFGITVVDENGKTRAGRSLGDFYADVG